MRYFVGFTVIIFFFSAPANAKTRTTVANHFLASLIGEAVRYNPQIKAAEARWRAATNAIHPARTLPDPKVLFSYENVHPKSFPLPKSFTKSPA